MDAWMKMLILTILVISPRDLSMFVGGSDKTSNADQCLQPSRSGQECDALSSRVGISLTSKMIGNDDNLENVQNPLLPALTPSLFSNVPPTVNFVHPGQEREQFPETIRRRLVWLEPGSIVMTSIANHSGFSLTNDRKKWIGCYTGCWQPGEISRYKTLRPEQKYSHIPDSWTIGCKDRLARNIQRMRRLYGKKNFDFVPPTYVLPKDMEKLRQAWSSGGEGQLWIIKPPCFHGGRGIRCVRKFAEIPQNEHLVIQRYISNPYLVNGYKCDLRIFVHITSIDPLRVYIYENAVVKFATKKFTTDSLDKMIHLTNLEINTKNPQYTLDYSMNTGHKWSLTRLWEYMKIKDNIDHKPIWEAIKDITLKTIISGEHDMFEGTQRYANSRYNIHELLGFDILLDENLKPWVLEANLAPGISAHPGGFNPVNEPMTKDALNLAGFRIPGDRNNGDEEESQDILSHLLLDERWWNQPLSEEEKYKHKYYCAHHDDEEILSTILDNLTPDDVRILVDTIDENARRGGFIRVFPRIDTMEYDNYFRKPRYHNLLIRQWWKRFHRNKTEGIALVESHCKQHKYLQNET